MSKSDLNGEQNPYYSPHHTALHHDVILVHFGLDGACRFHCLGSRVYYRNACSILQTSWHWYVVLPFVFVLALVICSDTVVAYNAPGLGESAAAFKLVRQCGHTVHHQ